MNAISDTYSRSANRNDEILPCSGIEDPSTQAIRVVVYSSDEAVLSQRFVAYITVPTRNPKTKATSERRLGISFPASDDASARAAAVAWWQTQLDRERDRLKAAEERGERLAASREKQKQAASVAAVQS